LTTRTPGSGGTSTPGVAPLPGLLSPMAFIAPSRLKRRLGCCAGSPESGAAGFDRRLPDAWSGRKGQRVGKTAASHPPARMEKPQRQYTEMAHAN
jgi:hypothetical protein